MTPRAIVAELAAIRVQLRRSTRYPLRGRDYVNAAISALYRLERAVELNGPKPGPKTRGNL